MKKYLIKKKLCKDNKKNSYLCQKFCIMKAFFYMLLIMLFLTFCGCASKGKNPEAQISEEINTTISFVSTEHDLGQAVEGEKVITKFELVNTGNANLIIHDVRASCGCTKPKFDKKPIPPGQKSVIEVTFDTKGRQGMRRNNVVVTTNTDPSTTYLSFTCEVLSN